MFLKTTWIGILNQNRKSTARSVVHLMSLNRRIRQSGYGTAYAGSVFIKEYLILFINSF